MDGADANNAMRLTHNKCIRIKSFVLIQKESIPTFLNHRVCLVFHKPLLHFGIVFVKTLEVKGDAPSFIFFYTSVYLEVYIRPYRGVQSYILLYLNHQF